ncbi:DUF4169 family protein [Sphingomonas sp. AP4-R1]|uniref:DUF4169 family protein n=1 Tax=Sphingomonas sp. AP4-R1 TaxID=2735134 RepID=UPI0014937DAB|nr:DUF4169 family protein [Sphingomonas sp. AP4-R1]QJU57480.1 DUF4169 family protein [Sphingomonas sp. AP4-R1]
MGEIINLRTARKAKARKDADVKASANRALHGRTTAEKTRDRIEAERLARVVDGAKLEGDDR